jgi:hypothetical protein
MSVLLLKADIGVTFDLNYVVGLQLWGPVFKSRGSANAIKPVQGCVRGVPPFNNPVTSVPLGRLPKERRLQNRTRVCPVGLQCEIAAARSRCPPFRESVRNLELDVYGGKWESSRVNQKGKVCVLVGTR